MKKTNLEKKVTIWITEGTRQRLKEYQKGAKARDMDAVVSWGLDVLQEIKRKAKK